jgi:hypothetical protein
MTVVGESAPHIANKQHGTGACGQSVFELERTRMIENGVVLETSLSQIRLVLAA